MAKSVKFKNNAQSPKQIVRAMRQGMADAVVPVMKQHVALRDLATEGWSSRNKPKIKWEVIAIGNSNRPLIFRVDLRAPNARQANKSVYRLLSDGTTHRHAAMAGGYSRKTRPGRLGNFGSGGAVAFISKNYEGISPDTGEQGITARSFDENINQTLKYDFERLLYKGGKNGLKR